MNVPNALSLLRIAMVPAFVGVFFSGLPNAHRWAGLIFLLAAFTDMLDGRIARKYNKITRLGRVLDPLADKLMTAAALVCIIISKMIPLWIFIVFAIKEILMGLGSVILYKYIDDVPPSNILGKASTVVFFTSCLVMMLFEVPPTAATVVMTCALALTLIAFVGYALNMFRLLAEKKAAH